MVTLSIAEQNDTITTLIQTALQKKGICFGHNRLSGSHDYTFLSPETTDSCDILLMHDPKIAPHAHADYITLLNTDQTTHLLNKQALLVTYGFNPRASVTVSSLRSEASQTEMFCCIQRTLITLKGRLIEPQEFSLMLPTSSVDPLAALAFTALGLILSLTPGEFAHILL